MRSTRRSPGRCAHGRAARARTAPFRATEGRRIRVGRTRSRDPIVEAWRGHVGGQPERRLRWSNPVPQKTLHIARLMLLPLADEHLEWEVKLDSDPEVMRYLSGRASSREEVEANHARRMA